MVFNNEMDKWPTYVVLGSGGHTAEMTKIVKELLYSNPEKERYNPVIYLIADTDKNSKQKFLMEMEQVGLPVTESAFKRIPRSREVGQNWFTTVFSTLWALLWSIRVVWQDQPQLVLCNGPGTCVPICLATYILRTVRRLRRKTRIIFVESFCRVNTLSLSGKLLMPFADLVVVQWSSLKEKYKNKQKVMYFGQLM